MNVLLIILVLRVCWEEDRGSVAVGVLNTSLNMIFKAFFSKVEAAMFALHGHGVCYDLLELL